MFKPIPKTLLPHDAVLITKIGGNAITPPTEVSTALENVRIVGKSNLTYADQGVTLACSKTLYFDGVNSRPKTTVFKTGDRVTFGADTYTIKTVNPVSTDTRNDSIHHWEVGLV